MGLPLNISWILSLTHWAIVLVLGVRVIMRRRPVGVSLSWLAILLLLPFVGALLYLLFGELRLGRRRERVMMRLSESYESWLDGLTDATATEAHLGPHLMPIARQGRALSGAPALIGNAIELSDHTDTTLRRMIDDIDAAERSIGMEFYIWWPGGLADEVLEALMRAAGRGVKCRVLVDSIGSREFLCTDAVPRAREAGVQIVEALPARILRTFRRRQDLRLHRKIVVIDDRLGYTGSLNLADAREFRKGTGVGPWIDVMARVRGPAVAALEAIFLADWHVETGEDVRAHIGFNDNDPGRPGDSIVQVLPSGPGSRAQAAYHSLLSAVFAARRRLVITTPYFVPDETVEAALVCAAERGAEVTLIVPKVTDYHVVRLAGQASFQTLLDAGVRIARFRDGMLHAKAITVDDEIALVGSVNLDARSFWLNYEQTMVVFDPKVVAELNAIQDRYIAASDILDGERWRGRGVWVRFLENTIRLFSPIL